MCDLWMFIFFCFAQHDVYIFLYKLKSQLIASFLSTYIYTRSYVLLRVCISKSKDKLDVVYII